MHILCITFVFLLLFSMTTDFPYLVPDIRNGVRTPSTKTMFLPVLPEALAPINT